MMIMIHCKLSAVSPMKCPGIMLIVLPILHALAFHFYRMENNLSETA